MPLLCLHQRCRTLRCFSVQQQSLTPAPVQAARFSGWGDEFYVLMVSTIVLNQAVGPPLFRSAIATMGEGRACHFRLHRTDGRGGQD